MFIIQESPTTPYIKLDSEECTLTIIGKSYPEYSTMFYEPILKEIEKCKDKLIDKKIIIKVSLEILNSISTKYLFHLMKIIYQSSNEMQVSWYYEEDDECMREEGKYFKSFFPKSDFRLIGVEDLREI